MRFKGVGDSVADFTKYQALGNDCLVLDARRLDWQPSPQAAQQLCDRRFGIGADGVLFGGRLNISGDRMVVSA